MKPIFLSVLLFALTLPAVGKTTGHHSRPAPRHTSVPHSRTPTVRPHGPTVRPKSPSTRTSLELEGISTWYGPEMKVNGHYNKMANGQVFDPRRLTAASLTLPLGKIVRVTNEKTGLSVDVEITDRGPFVRGRILDLAEAAAKAIQCNGTCRVQITEVPVPEGDSSS